MKLWIDAQLPPALAAWLPNHFDIEASTLEAIGMHTASDLDIFMRLRTKGEVIMSKDEDFVDIATRFGPPPQILWVTCGNVTNRALQTLLIKALPDALEHLRKGEPVIEITGP